MMDTYRIFHVDDNPDWGKLYGLLFTHEKFKDVLPYTVDYKFSDCPTKTMSIIADYQPHIVIVDHIMPDIYGDVIVAGIRSRPEYDHIRLIVATPAYYPETYKDYLDDYLLLPVHPMKFLASIQRSIELYIEANGELEDA